MYESTTTIHCIVDSRISGGKKGCALCFTVHTCSSETWSAQLALLRGKVSIVSTIFSRNVDHVEGIVLLGGSVGCDAHFLGIRKVFQCRISSAPGLHGDMHRGTVLPG